MIHNEHESSGQIQTDITLDSYVRLRTIIYRDTQNWTRNPWANSNNYYFWLGCMIEAHDISRRSKLNTEALGKLKQPLILTRMLDWDSWYIETPKIEHKIIRKTQMVITFDSDVRFRPIIYQDARNSIRKHKENLKGHNFDSHVRFKNIIYWDAPNLTWKHWGNSNGHNFWCNATPQGHWIEDSK